MRKIWALDWQTGSRRELHRRAFDNLGNGFHLRFVPRDDHFPGCGALSRHKEITRLNSFPNHVSEPAFIGRLSCFCDYYREWAISLIDDTLAKAVPQVWQNARSPICHSFSSSRLGCCACCVESCFSAFRDFVEQGSTRLLFRSLQQ